ncbi:Rieske (2Fe-2S) protein [Paenibacillus sp. GD4]|uniref:Rieske (2Fe-2S) protein n=1 Tax=Paenibacillus sp. GD4 TaxID=3068890 RepID=UPI0027963E30|nr:Rieske (2Fe-2S) protein [Paenibacillus sp. GD4]MDQ1910347.1 Rieske (2Fe-2S) protein [Paenibacillus sp. GD4]
MAETRIGAVMDFTSFPAEVSLDNQAYYLVKDGADYRLFSRRCPHAGARVEAADDCFECPVHGWTFDLETGACENVPSASLKSLSVIEREGALFAAIE